MKRIIKVIECKTVIERSKFISYVYNCDNREELNSLLDEIRKIHHSATHVCFGCILQDKNEVYFSDDGEPSNTAGLPIIRALQENELIYTLVIVVRYFGGIKLGVPGLFRAYKESAEACLKNNTKEVTLKKLFEGKTSYGEFSNLKKYFDKKSISIYNVKFSDQVNFYVYLDEKEFKYISKFVKLNFLEKTKYMS